MGAYKHSPFTQSKLLFHTFKHSVFFFFLEAWNSELQQINVFLKDYIAADASQTIYLLWET